MKFNQCAAQGDLLISKIDSLPTGLIEQKPEAGKHILAHSETGHHHVIPSNDANLFVAKNDNGFMAFIVVEKETQIEHLRSFDTHKALTVLPGTYQINRQREYTPEGFRRAAD